MTGPQVVDNSVNPASKPSFYQLPSTTAAPRIVRTFKFDRLNGQWSINGQFMDCNTFRFAVQQNSVGNGYAQLTGDWTSRYTSARGNQILTRNRVPPTVATDMGHARM